MHMVVTLKVTRIKTCAAFYLCAIVAGALMPANPSIVPILFPAEFGGGRS